MVVYDVILWINIVLYGLSIESLIVLERYDIFLIINKKVEIGGSYREVLFFTVDVLQRFEKLPLELGH